MKKLINLAGLQFFQIFKFKSQLTPFKNVGFFKMGFKSFNRLQGLTYVKIKKLFGAVFFYSDFSKLKSWKNNSFWYLGTKNLSKPIQLYINRFGFPMRIFCRKPIEKMFCSSKDIRENQNFFFSRGSYIKSLWNSMFKLVSNKNY